MQLPVWVRHGTCQAERCQSACCKSLILEVNPAYQTDPDVANWIGLHGIELFERDGRTLARLPIPCSALDETGHCRLYGLPERPRLCAAFPDTPAALDGVSAVCTFAFTAQRAPVPH